MAFGFAFGVWATFASDGNPFSVILLFALVTAGLFYGAAVGAISGAVSGVVIVLCRGRDTIHRRLLSGCANAAVGAGATYAVVANDPDGTYGLAIVAAVSVWGYFVGYRLVRPDPATAASPVP
jgi:hypothetical protein